MRILRIQDYPLQTSVWMNWISCISFNVNIRRWMKGNKQIPWGCTSYSDNKWSIFKKISKICCQILLFNFNAFYWIFMQHLQEKPTMWNSTFQPKLEKTLNVLLQSTPAIQEENNIISPSLTIKIRKFQKYELLSLIRYTLYVINSYVVLCTSQENNLNSNKDNKFDVD